MSPGAPLRILVVDDHEVVRRGLASVIARREELQVVGEAGTAAEAVKLAQELVPDVVVMDVRLPDGSGVEACREIRSHRPETRVLMLTSYSDEDAVMGAIMAGAAGYLLKQIGSEELLRAIEQVGAGQSLLDPTVTGRLLDRIRSDDRTKRLNVVILTSSKEEADIVRGYDLNVNSYIRKPVNFDQFTEAIKQVGLYWLVLNVPPPLENAA